ncbi:MAG: winged helix-turn-helix transcriptional regulator [Sulfitobacter sp.]
MDINLLVNISARAWSLRILALMHRGVVGRQAPLLSASGASRTAFAQSLKHLVDLGLLERTAGHGHPLRPEYQLTPLGTKAAARADRIDLVAPQTAESSLLRRSWTVPILAVSRQPMFFSQIKSSLPAITDRALSQSLKQLEGQDWLARRIVTQVHPPRALYQAMHQGAQISAAAGLDS